MNQDVLYSIAGSLLDIAESVLTVAEKQIVGDLIRAGYLMFDGHDVLKRVKAEQKTDVIVYETVVVKKVYTIETDNPAIALAQAALGNTLRETHVETISVIGREVDGIKSDDFVQTSDKTMAEGFEVTVLVTLQVDSEESHHTRKDLSDTALEAITRCMNEQEKAGFVHKLAGEVSIGVREIKVTDTF